jgi:hypothetical protein
MTQLAAATPLAIAAPRFVEHRRTLRTAALPLAKLRSPSPAS